MKKILLFLTIFGFTFSVFSQTTIYGYDKARDTYFWKKLYKDGGETLYCEQSFDSKKSKDGLSVEHIYPASWIAYRFGCKNRHSCSVDMFKYAEADLHNLYPARLDINMARNNLHFGEIKDEKYRIKKNVCIDFERMGNKLHGIVEPRDKVKGNIARSMFYMELVYDLPLGRTRNMLLKWDKKDPVDEQEIERNKMIKDIQGELNPFIGIMKKEKTL